MKKTPRMDASELEPCLGKMDTDPEVQHLLKTLGIAGKLRLDRDGHFRVASKELGLNLMFARKAPKSSEIMLWSVQYYSDAEEGYTNFQGELPRSLSWDDKPADVKKKLGKPSDEVKLFRLQHWNSGDRQLSVRYRKGHQGIAYVISGFAPED